MKNWKEMTMDIRDRIDAGKRCAHGIDQSVDLEKAYQMWNGIEAHLSAEDKILYGWIRDIVTSCEPKGAPSDWHQTPSAGSPCVMPISTVSVAKKEKAYTEADVRRKFDELLTEAMRGGTLDSLYHALERYHRARTKPKDVNPALVRMGNNIGYLVSYYWSSIDNFFNSMNKVRREKGLPEKKSIQGLYQVIGGKNGMDDSGKMLVIEMANQMAQVRRVGLVRPLVTEDLQLPFEQFVSLFQPMKTDEKTRRLLMRSQPIAVF